MAHLIDKDAVVAEIKWKISNFHMAEDERNQARASELLSLLSYLDTLEVKEVDLEKEYQEYVEKDPVYNKLVNGIVGKAIVKHFFELGLKAQHDNWKVVDNINPPQADKNKIYCVFTKGRYILAKVIEHPKDEESLQWKCTEFPHHRYDMCEGDKYMVIN